MSILKTGLMLRAVYLSSLFNEYHAFVPYQVVHALAAPRMETSKQRALILDGLCHAFCFIYCIIIFLVKSLH